MPEGCLPGGNPKSCCESGVVLVCSGSIRIQLLARALTHTRTRTNKRAACTQRDEEQPVGRSHCEINEFFTISTLTATGWVS